MPASGPVGQCGSVAVCVCTLRVLLLLLLATCSGALPTGRGGMLT